MPQFIERRGLAILLYPDGEIIAFASPQDALDALEALCWVRAASEAIVGGLGA